MNEYYYEVWWVNSEDQRVPFSSRVIEAASGKQALEIAEIEVSEMNSFKYHILNLTKL